MKTLTKWALLPALCLTLGIAAASRTLADDIVDTAVNSGKFPTLVAAVKAAGLVDTLKGPGPFTVFAPTEAAFKKIPAKTLQMLLKPENKDKLTAILTYHVLPKEVDAADVLKLKSGTKVSTVQGAPVTVSIKGKSVFINKAKVIQTDIKCDNGVIHVIDAVLMPPMKKAMKGHGKM